MATDKWKPSGHTVRIRSAAKTLGFRGVDAVRTVRTVFPLIFFFGEKYRVPLQKSSAEPGKRPMNTQQCELLWVHSSIGGTPWASADKAPDRGAERVPPIGRRREHEGHVTAGSVSNT